jgi:hypothetical protein
VGNRVHAALLPSVTGALAGTGAYLLLDRVDAAHRRLAADAAEQALAIDELRRFSEASVLDEALRLGPETSRLSRTTIARRILVSELACLLRLPDRTMETLIGVSTNLIHTLPATFAVLHAGGISYRHAAVLVDQTAGLTAENTAALERTVLGSAGELTVSQFTQKTRKARERLDAESIPARHERGVADRALFYEPAADGMAWLSIFLPAAQAAGDLHEGHQRRHGPAGTERVADVDPVAGGRVQRPDPRQPGRPWPRAGSGSRFTGVKPDVFLLVPALTLLGRSDEPAILEGYGPIDLRTAKQLAGRAKSFLRILTHPETGTFLSLGRTRYKPPKDLRTLIRLRDGTCRSPNCTRNAAHTDIDHSIDWGGGNNGETNITNLASLCPKHHRDKHEIGWRYVQNENGTLHWTSPMGRVYDTEPENRMGLASAPATAPATGSADTTTTDTTDTADTAETTPAIPEDDPPPF